jgi:Mob1/phocein family
MRASGWLTKVSSIASAKCHLFQTDSDTVVEQYRLLDLMVQIVRTADEKTGVPVCNPEACPTMSASGYVSSHVPCFSYGLSHKSCSHTYTWLDNNKRPIKIPACQYIQLVQKWIIGKISDPNLFPTDTNSTSANFATTPGANTPIAAGPTSLHAPLSALTGREWMGKDSGFPENFETDIKSIYRQMMRCYAHLYHGHWLDPFWHIGAYKELNTCFIHFINVGKLFGLIGDKEMEPMQPLIDIWMAKGLLPALTASKPEATPTSATPTA